MQCLVCASVLYADVELFTTAEAQEMPVAYMADYKVAGCDWTVKCLVGHFKKTKTRCVLFNRNNQNESRLEWYGKYSYPVR